MGRFIEGEDRTSALFLHQPALERPAVLVGYSTSQGVAYDFRSAVDLSLQGAFVTIAPR
jgi:hypothetical protein